MTKDEIKALIASKIAGQGTAVDVASALPTILEEILDIADTAASEISALKDEIETMGRIIVEVGTEDYPLSDTLVGAKDLGSEKTRKILESPILKYHGDYYYATPMDVKHFTGSSANASSALGYITYDDDKEPYYFQVFFGHCGFDSTDVFDESYRAIVLGYREIGDGVYCGYIASIAFDI